MLYRFVLSNSILRGRRVALLSAVRVQLYANLFAGTVAHLRNKEKTPLHGITCSARVGGLASQDPPYCPTCQLPDARWQQAHVEEWRIERLGVIV